jgi:hypothetical protein
MNTSPPPLLMSCDAEPKPGALSAEPRSGGRPRPRPVVRASACGILRLRPMLIAVPVAIRAIADADPSSHARACSTTLDGLQITDTPCESATSEGLEGHATSNVRASVQLQLR